MYRTAGLHKSLRVQNHTRTSHYKYSKSSVLLARNVSTNQVPQKALLDAVAKEFNVSQPSDWYKLSSKVTSVNSDPLRSIEL